SPWRWPGTPTSFSGGRGPSDRSPCLPILRRPAPPAGEGRPPAEPPRARADPSGHRIAWELTPRATHGTPLAWTAPFEQSGKEALSPAPPPLRIARAGFPACSSSLGQCPCEIRPGPAPPADDTPSGTRWPHWPWGPPERYCGSAGYRNDFPWRL